ncbi:MAG: hemolysin activation protein [Prevotella sp.]|nr:hemolysin activation protein [Prevotella sp.]
MKHPAKTDVAVLMLFFTRSDTFQKVFEAVRQARPSKLLLFQDGPRGEKDMAGIEACRQIVCDENIDWDCEVHRNYQAKNLGCDPSEYLSQKWAFSLVEKCIVLEDDDVPSQSFFPFCKEMLDRYADDERISMIAGFNIDEETPDCPYDYFFTSVFSIWGWASWRRVVDKWEGQYDFLDDKYAMRQLRALVKQRGYRQDAIQMFYDHRATGKEYYESIFWASMMLNSGLAVMPSKNLIQNLGLTTDSTHFSSSQLTTPHRLRRIFTMSTHELSFPLKHPPYVIEDVEYKERLYRVNAWNHPWLKIQNSLEELLLNLRHGNFRQIGTALTRRIRKWLGLAKHV